MANEKSLIRETAKAIKPYRCKNLIAVIEDPNDIRNIGTIIRNVNALGVEKTYIVDPKKKLPDDWQEMRERKSLSKTSVSAIKWSFVKRFDSTEDCLNHLERYRYISIATSPHIKGKKTVILHEGDYTHPRVAIWFGNEARGRCSPRGNQAVWSHGRRSGNRCLPEPLARVGTSSGPLGAGQH